MKKSTKILIFKLTILVLLPSYGLPYNSNLLEKTGKFLYSRVLPITIASLYFAHFSSEETGEQLKEQLQPKNLLINFAQQYFFNLIATITHELGHSITAKILNDNPIKIHLNLLKPKDGSSSKLLIKKSLIQKNLKEKIKYGATYLSGGISGAIAMLTLSLILKKIVKQKENVHVDPIIIEQLFNAFIPLSKTSDAAKSWKNCFNFSDKTIEIASQIQVFLYWLAEFYITHKQTKSIDTNPLDEIFLMLINLNTKGFFRFHI